MRALKTATNLRYGRHRIEQGEGVQLTALVRLRDRSAQLAPDVSHGSSFPAPDDRLAKYLAAGQARGW